MEPESRTIEHADEIVSFAKKVSREVASFRVPEGLDFVGASEGYVQEKLRAAIEDMRWLSRRIKEVDQANRKKAPQRD